MATGHEQPSRLVVQFPRLGPYHAARLEAAGGRGDVLALETSAGADAYLWETAAGGSRFARQTLPAGAPGRLARTAAALARARPDVVALCGWSEPGALAGLRFCLRARVPALVMSDSRRPVAQAWWIRALKARLVRLFGAGLVGGAAHAEYLAEMGLPRERIFTGYDAVDNDHFARGADEARLRAASVRRERGLPDRYFLACQRLIPEKNLPGLLAGFARYRRQAGHEAWDLVIAGDGPLREEVVRRLVELELGPHVRMLGALGYQELPAVYGLAGALVQASTSDTWGLAVNEAMAAALPVLVSRACGCAAELVREGETGFSFEPNDGEALAGLLLRLSRQDEARRAAMGRAARAAIARLSPEAFADGLWSAARAAAAAGRAQPDRLAAALVSTLARR